MQSRFSRDKNDHLFCSRKSRIFAFAQIKAILVDKNLNLRVEIDSIDTDINPGEIISKIIKNSDSYIINVKNIVSLRPSYRILLENYALLKKVKICKNKSFIYWDDGFGILEISVREILEDLCI